MENNRSILGVFIDSDVLFAGSASPNIHSASNVILQMGEITLIRIVASEQVITEVSRNLSDKMPQALPIFKRIVKRCVQVIPNPAFQDVEDFSVQADWKDAPILAAAINARCQYLVTFNIRDYWPEDNIISVLQPGEFLGKVREMLANLD
jgi:predicted nucleic acid-binding protein